MRPSRRDFLITGAAALGAGPLARFAGARTVQPRIQFVNQLPVPPVIDMRSGGSLTMRVKRAKQWFGISRPGSVRPGTTIYGYEGRYPGPTILARHNVPIEVKWVNELVDSMGMPFPHMLPIDNTVHWADPYKDGSNRAVPIVTHLHGAHTASQSDGHPDAWHLPNLERVGRLYWPTYLYENTQESGTLWYHDHTLGITRLNVFAGMAGAYLLTDDNEQYLIDHDMLPKPKYDVPLLIQDKMFDATGQLFYPADAETEGVPYPSVLPEFFGDTICVNGMAWPVLDVEPRTYRFRVINGCDSRFLHIFLDPQQFMFQVGADQGFFNTPSPQSGMLLGPAERADIVMDFRGQEGTTIVMYNTAKGPYPFGDPPDPETAGRIMAFRVSKPLDQSVPIAELPENLRPVLGPVPDFGTPVRKRRLVLFEQLDEYGRLLPKLGTAENGVMGWNDPVTETPRVGDVEEWEIFNLTEDAHTVHIHLVGFLLKNRQEFSAKADPRNGKLDIVYFVEKAVIPETGELGFKDTVHAYPDDCTRLLMRFDKPGDYMWHCHIASHEDHEMMRPITVLP
ncbi:MAG: multicopper oxidase domain-containing protein [Armatimonadetes bacterium]|nr:multicopper oxidase domain-containing protein [Armatimonadota bacterium]